MSRFRLHASFHLRAVDLSPFQLVSNESRSSDKICLRSSRSWQVPLSTHTKSTNLGPAISITGRVDLRLPKTRFSGYLNVQDPKSQHNWNRRWCSLDGVRLSVWQHEDNLESDIPIFTLELPGLGQSLIAAAPGSCVLGREVFCCKEGILIANRGESSLLPIRKRSSRNG